MTKIMNTAVITNGLCVNWGNIPILKKEIPIKILLIMKMIIVNIVVFCSFSFANLHAQKINIEVKGVEFKQIAKLIQKQTGYSFSISKRYLEKAKPVTLSIKSEELDKVLEELFKDQPFYYELKGKIIVVRDKPTRRQTNQNIMELQPTALAQQEGIRGRVTDSLGKPLPNVTVGVVGSSIWGKTNDNGDFVLIGATIGNTLQFSSMGYRTKSLIAESKEINATLSSIENTIAEVNVDRGYYTVKKELNTGTVSTVKGEVLHRQPVGDPLMALHGQVPGLYIAQSSGVPGASSTVRIRGRNSIANGNDPLYIVDGVPFISGTLSMTTAAGITQSPLATIGIDNIESIEVLKDADATAIYGSRGANGVILITTRKGKAGRTQVSANFSQGFGKVHSKYEMLNLEEYLQMRQEAFDNDNATPQDWDYDINGTWAQDRFTDWQDVFIGGTAHLSNQSVSLSGGNEQTQFLISGMHRNETTVFPGDYRNRKLSLQSNISHRSSDDRFKATFTTSYLDDNNLLPPANLAQYIILAPNAPALYTETGELNWENSTWDNPMSLINRTSTTITNNFNISLDTEYRIWDGLSIHARAGYNSILLNMKNLLPMSSYNPDYQNTPSLRRNQTVNNEIKSWIAEPSIHYNKEFSWGKLESLVGMTFQSRDQEGIYQTASGFSSDALIENLVAATSITVNSTINTQYRYNAVYGRIGYSFQDRYILNLTGRRDGSSRFGPGKQFGNFGAIGMGWILSKEGFWNNISNIVNFAKLRGSYGSTGNDQLTDYQYLSTYSSNGLPYQGVVGLNPTQLANPSFGWETVKKLEAALELGLWQDRLQLNIDWYRNRTGNQLVGYPLPGMTGFSSVQANMPAIIENKGWELDAQLQIFRDTPFKWNVSGNISIPKNKLVSFPNIEASTYNTQYIVGRPLTLQRSYIFTGLDPATGVFTFEDVDGDGNLTLANDSKHVFVGQHHFGGINHTLSYKGIGLSFDIQYVKQSGVWNEINSYSAPGSFFDSRGNFSRTLWDHWQSEGDQTYYQKYSQMFGSQAQVAFSLFQNSDAMIMDRSFIRMRNLYISYDFPKKWLESLKIGQLRIYGQVQNLFTITDYIGIDPELTSSALTLPPMRMVNMGVQINL